MKPEPIYSDTDRLMNVALFVSGSGTNARKIIERSLQTDSRYKVILIFTDIKDGRTRKNGSKMCYAKDIADEYGISYEVVDIRNANKIRDKRLKFMKLINLSLFSVKTKIFLLPLQQHFFMPHIYCIF